MGLTGWRLFSLIAAALLGGYALATASGILLGALIMPSRGEAAVMGNMLSFSVYTLAIIWAFHVRRPVLVWLGLLLPSTLLALAGLLLTGVLR